MKICGTTANVRFHRAAFLFIDTDCMSDKSNPDPGRIQVTITYLEMLAMPQPADRVRAEDASVVRVLQPSVPFYRFLYNTVGEPWLWYERRQMSDEKLREIIQSPQNEVYVLYAGGAPAGYGELDLRRMPDIELAYFGLMPQCIGKGLGMLLIDHMIAQAWSRGPRRFWLHTCTLDHPHALAFYQRAGFVPYAQETKMIDDPRALGAM